jgi:hypothetical protein
VIVHGDATGVDQSFGLAAKGLGLEVEPHPADWDRCRSWLGARGDAQGACVHQWRSSADA